MTKRKMQKGQTDIELSNDLETNQPNKRASDDFVTDPQEEETSNNLWIVGLGASAGGLEAFERFFTNMPPDTNMAFVIVQHLDPKRESMLVELIQRYTRMNVSQVEDKTEVNANQVYIIPPNWDMMIQNGILHLVKPATPRVSRLALDFFFRSLAEAQGERAIGIIMSGTGADGTLGLQAIKGEGGMIMVQSPKSSRYIGMPTNAINTSLVDFILDPEDMPQQLIQYIKHPHSTLLDIDTSRETEVDSVLQNIFVLLQVYTGHDFSLYKPNTVKRRIERRMVVNHIQQVTDYNAYLQQNTQEVEALFKELLIGVTKFFRDSEAFESLEQIIASDIIPNANSVEPIRVWVPGCSTGEEAYSIAILFQERLSQLQVKRKVQIFATDIDIRAIEQARTGIYPANISADVSPERLKQYFTKEGNTYRINKLLRDNMVFSVHNITQDPPFSRLNLLSCRNLLIYMRPMLQAKLYPLFHYALTANGILFLGNSESLGDFSNLFEAVDKKWKIFKVNENSAQNNLMMNFPAAIHHEAARLDLPNKRNVIRPNEAVEKLMLELHTPPAVVINEKGEIIYIHGHTGKYIEFAPGNVNLNILRMARQGLRMHLANAIKRAQTKKQTIVYENVKFKFNGQDQNIKLTVTPISEPPSMIGLMLIVFEIHIGSPINIYNMDVDVLDTRDQHVADLSKELDSTKQYLQSTIEELETSNEELTATNEELQSSNEELQSTNEELQTAKEELQSINEELVTVNTELEAKIDELSVVNDDMQNLFVGLNLGAVLLDLDLNIRRFTPAAQKVINLIEADLARPLSHTVCNLLDVDLVKISKIVLDTLETYTQDVQHKNGEWFWMQVRPYRTSGNQTRGIILTFTNIDRLKKQTEELNQRRNSDFELIMRISRVVFFEQDTDLQYIKTTSPHPNVGIPDDILGKSDKDMLDPVEATRLTEIKSNVLKSGEPRTEIVKTILNGKSNYYQLHVEPRRDSQGNIIGIMSAAIDITNFQSTISYYEDALRGRELGFYTHVVPPDDSTYHSPSWAALLGYKLKELPPPIERSTWVYEQTYPDDVEAFETAYNDFIEGKSQTHQVEYRLKHKSGKWVWVLTKSQALARDKDGRVLQLMGIMGLITK